MNVSVFFRGFRRPSEMQAPPNSDQMMVAAQMRTDAVARPTVP